MQLHDLDAALAEMKLATAGSATMEVWAAGIAWVRLGQIYDLKGQRQQAVAAYQKAIAGARTAAIEGAGHRPEIENGAEFERLVKQFLAA